MPTPGGVILPGEAPGANGRLTLYVPSGYESERDRREDPNAAGYHVCRVATDADGSICGATFELDQEREYLRHLRTCVSEHRDAIHAASPRTKIPLLDPAAWDPEVEAHMHDLGRKMRRERRLEVRPHERAGFS